MTALTVASAFPLDTPDDDPQTASRTDEQTGPVETLDGQRVDVTAFTHPGEDGTVWIRGASGVRLTPDDAEALGHWLISEAQAARTPVPEQP